MVYYFSVKYIQNLLQIIMARVSPWRRSEDVVSRVACGVHHFNPCLRTAVKTKQNKKQKAKTFSADGPCPCGARTSPKKLPFRDVHDVGISALIYIYSRSR